MSSQVQLFLRVHGQEKPVPSIPLNYEELLKAVNRETGLYHFRIKLGPACIASSRDLIVCYLNHQADRLVLEVEESRVEVGGRDPSSQTMLQSMMDKFRHLATGEELRRGRFEVREGTICKEDLLRVISAIKDYALAQLAHNSANFQVRRLQHYGVDEDQYKRVILEQIHFQKRLMLLSTVSTCRKLGVAQEVFDASCARWFQEAEIRTALEEMTTESAPTQGEVPVALTREELKRVLAYSCGFTNRYIDEHPHMHQIDALVLKVKEADEIFKRFRYNEAEITAALSHYKVETDPYWEDIRALMGEITQKLFRFQGVPMAARNS